MMNFKTTSPTKQGCTVVSTIKGRVGTVEFFSPVNSKNGGDTTEDNLRLSVYQYNGRNKGSIDVIGLGNQKGIYLCRPSKIRVLQAGFTQWFGWKNIYNGQTVYNGESDFGTTGPYTKTTYNKYSFEVWTDEKDGKNIKFGITVTYVPSVSKIDYYKNVAATEIQKTHELEVKKLQTENASLKAKINNLEKHVKEKCIPKHVNKQASDALAKSLNTEHVTSYDVEFFSSYLKSKNGPIVQLPSRMQKALERNVPAKGRPPIAPREVYAPRQGLGYLNRNAISFVPAGPQPVKRTMAYHAETAEFYD